MNEEVLTQETEEPTEASEAPADELSDLRARLRAAEAALSERDGRETRLRGEFEDFMREFPDVPLGEIGAEVFEQMKAGVPLAAAYALSLHRKKRSVPSPHGTWQRVGGGSEEGLFSPAEVRAMTPMEVRQHYPRIMESMKHWQK